MTEGVTVASLPAVMCIEPLRDALSQTRVSNEAARFDEGLEVMLDPRARAEFSEACRRRRRPNGAGQAAALIAELAA